MDEFESDASWENAINLMFMNQYASVKKEEGENGVAKVKQEPKEKQEAKEKERLENKEEKEVTKKKSEVLSNMDDNMNRVSKRRNNIDESGSKMLQAKKPKK